MPRASCISVGAMLLAGVVVFAHGCGPRKGSKTANEVATTAAPTATPTAAPTPAPTPAPTAPPTGTIGIPGFGFGLPMSPRQALIGKWNVANVDGKPVPAGGVGTDPMDPATYIAGSGVVFTADTVTITRNGGTLFSRPYKVLQEVPPVRVVIDAGYGASNVDFAIDGSCVWSLPSTPPHAVQLTRAQ